MGISLAGWIDGLDCAPWPTAAGRRGGPRVVAHAPAVSWERPLYTPEQRRRRDATPWTLVQGVLAPVQATACLLSLVLVARFLLTGEGYTAASASVLVKTALLLAIMVTGSFWERAVFGRWLFAPAFWWEDLVSMLVIALHAAYVVALFAHLLPPAALMGLAVLAYAAYGVNATQFVLKLRAARRGAPRAAAMPGTLTASLRVIQAAE